MHLENHWQSCCERTIRMSDTNYPYALKSELVQTKNSLLCLVPTWVGIQRVQTGTKGYLIYLWLERKLCWNCHQIHKVSNLLPMELFTFHCVKVFHWLNAALIAKVLLDNRWTRHSYSRPLPDNPQQGRDSPDASFGTANFSEEAHWFAVCSTALRVKTS